MAPTLTNAACAVIDRRKIEEYVLNPHHPVGRHKARVFAAALGFDRSNVQLLIDEIRRGVLAYSAEPGRSDEYGARYRVDMVISGPKGRTRVRTAWIYRTGSDVPELITVHVH